MVESSESIGILAISWEGKRAEELEDNREEMILGIKRMLKDQEENQLLTGKGMRGMTIGETLEIKTTEGETEETEETEEIEEIEEIEVIGEIGDKEEIGEGGETERGMTVRKDTEVVSLVSSRKKVIDFEYLINS